MYLKLADFQSENKSVKPIIMSLIDRKNSFFSIIQRSNSKIMCYVLGLRKLVDLLLTCAGITREDIYETVMKSWVSKNLDLLTSAEQKRYKGKVLI